jgi:GDSL-like Lipase/Acylhydrolase family
LHTEVKAMTSVVITGRRYLTNPREAERFGPFGHTFLAEGDSWMDASAWNQGSLPEFLVRAYNRRNRSNLVINISTSGHTLTRIVDMMNGEFAWWLNQFAYDGILLSAGGNDFIDAARDTPAGQGLLHDMQGQPLPADGYACVNQGALRTLVDDYLNPNFAAIHQAVRRSRKNAQTPIWLNSYDTPTARDAPAIRNLSGPWLYAAYTKNHIDPTLWPSLTAGLFADIKQTIEGWAAGRDDVHVVPTTGLLMPAAAGSTGDSNDWVNEIHPNDSGWRKQAEAWVAQLPG